MKTSVKHFGLVAGPYGPPVKGSPQSHFFNDEKNNIEKKLRNEFTKYWLIW